MTKTLTHSAAFRAWPIAVLLVTLQLLLAPGALLAQDGDETPGPTADQAASDGDDEGDDEGGEAGGDETQASQEADDPPQERPNILQLFVSGGWLMFPILVMLVIVVFFSIERGFGLMRRKVLPSELIDEPPVTALANLERSLPIPHRAGNLQQRPHRIGDAAFLADHAPHVLLRHFQAHHHTVAVLSLVHMHGVRVVNHPVGDVLH